jgi:hypothetical protein
MLAYLLLFKHQRCLKEYKQAKEARQNWFLSHLRLALALAFISPSYLAFYLLLASCAQPTFYLGAANLLC